MDKKNFNLYKDERKKALARERSRRYRERKRLNEILKEEDLQRIGESNKARAKKYREQKQGDYSNEMKDIRKQDNANREKALARERSRRYRQKKRLNVQKSVNNVHNSQIPCPSHESSSFVLTNKLPTIHNSQIAGATNLDILNDDNTVEKCRKRKQHDHTEEMKALEAEEYAKHKKELSKERSRRYRERKRLNALKSVHEVFPNSQIPDPSQGNPTLILRNQQTTFQNSQIAGTSTNIDS